MCDWQEVVRITILIREFLPSFDSAGAWAHVSNAEVLQRSGLSAIGDILRH